jgi:hypothetical protein
MPTALDWISGDAVSIRWPSCLKKALGLAAAEHGSSIASFIESILLAALISRGLVDGE